MKALILIVVITYIIFLLQRKIWAKEKNIIFPIVTIVFYFWSLAGAWLFCFDSLTPFGKSIGLNYHYLLERMFMVKLDHTYLLTICSYGFFIVAFQLFCLFALKFLKNKVKVSSVKRSIFPIVSTPISLLAFVCLLISFFVVKDVIFYSLILDESLYINIRGSQIPNYAIHQYMNWILIVSQSIYLGLFLRNDDFMIKPTKPNLLFWFIFILSNIYLVSIGSRHETFFSGILIILLMIFPNRKWQETWKSLIVILGVLALIIALNDPIRSLMPRIAKSVGITNLVSNKVRIEESKLFQIDRSFSFHHSAKLSRKYIFKESLKDTIITLKDDTTFTIKKVDLFAQISAHPNYIIVNGVKIIFPNAHISTAYDEFGPFQKIVKAFTTMIFSNELFAGHFSMYGIIHKNISPSYGVSFNSLYQSFKFEKYRDSTTLDSYSYYAKKLNLPSNQGFTINHVSSWYLNFSYFGFIIGSFILVVFLFIPYYISLKTQTIISRTIGVVVLCSITSFSAIIVRTGPEGYKSLIYEGILIPIVILLGLYYYNVLVYKIQNRKKL